MMRGSARYSGALLLYGQNAPAPDLSLALQFLIDDLRFDGRTASSISLKSASLRLRIDGHELIIAHTGQPLSPRSFHGALRPQPPAESLADTDEPVPMSGDLARGRVVHAIRSHRYVVSLLLRPRGTQAIADPAQARLALTRECRALIEPVIEAAAPSLIIWQPEGLTFTPEEFTSTRAEALIRPGPVSPLVFDATPGRKRLRPSFDDTVVETSRPRRALASTAIIDAAVEPATTAAPPALLVAPGRSLVVRPPASRDDRIARASSGRLFGASRAGGRPAPLPRLHRHDARLAEAMRSPVENRAPTDSIWARRRVNIARAANCAAILLWYAYLIPPLTTGL